MGDYLRIARAYVNSTTIVVWCFMLFCLWTFSVAGAELAHSQGTILGGVLSRKSYMAMFVYFNACVLGVLLRDNIAHLWASVLPHYRQKHLQVTALIAVFFLAIPMFMMEFVGTSDVAPMSVAVIFLTCLAAGLWTLHHPALGFLAFPFLFFVMTPASFIPGLTALLAGANPVASAVLILVSLLALGVLAWRLLVLNEDMVEYAIARLWGDLLRGRGQTFGGQSKTITDYLAALPADKRTTLQNFAPLKYPFSNLKQVDNLNGYSERSLWQRLQLWRLGTTPTRASASVGSLILFTLIIIPPMVLMQRTAGGEHAARDSVVIFSVQVMTNPFNILLFWFMRRPRLGYESLRPRTRQEFVRELGLSIMWDITQCWLGGILCLVIAAAIWAPELLQVKNIMLFVFCTGAGQLCAYALTIWFLKRGMVTSICWALGTLMALAGWLLITMNGSTSIEVNIAIATVLAAASLATIALAYRHWCQADLD
jgi:hypothetical protein